MKKGHTTMIRRQGRWLTIVVLLVSLVVSGACWAYDSPPTFVQEWNNYYHVPFNPAGLALNPSTNALFTTDVTNRNILKYDATSLYFLRKWKGAAGQGEAGEFILPEDVAVNTSTRDVYIVDTGRHCVNVFDSEGAFLRKWGQWGDGGSKMKFPLRISIDASGYVYVADVGHRVIKKFSETGTLISAWGGIGTGPGQFSGMFSVAASPLDNSIYAGDWGNFRIQKFNSISGAMILSFGESGNGPGQFGSETELAVDPTNGRVFVSDKNKHRIQVFDTTGGFLFQWGLFGSGEGQFKYPGGIAVGNDGKVYVNDTGNNRIQVFSNDGTFIKQKRNGIFTPEELTSPSGVTVEQSTGHVYVVDQARGNIKKYDEVGNLLLNWGSVGSDNGQFKTPTGIVVDNDGNVYVVEEGNHRVQKFNAQGQHLATYGNYGTGPNQFNCPTDIAIDPDSGRIFVSERFNHRIQVFDAAWNFIRFISSYGSADDQINNPFGVEIHPISKNVYVADTMHRRIKVFDQDGNFIRMWGNSDGSGPGDFAWPRNVAIDANGDVYVADTDHNRIQKFDGNGNFLLMIESNTQTGILFHPRAVAVDRLNGSVYVTASYESQMHKFDSSGSHLLSWGYLSQNAPGEFRSPLAAVSDAAGEHIYITEHNKHTIQTFDLHGNLVMRFGESGQHYEDYGTDFPEGIAVGSNGNVYVACGAHADPENPDTPLRYIKVFSPDGQYLYRWGGYPQEQRTKGVVVSREGDDDFVYIIVRAIGKIRKFDTNGNLLLEFGGVGSDDGRFQGPWGICVNPANGDIYVADNTAGTIQRFDCNGAFIAKWSGFAGPAGIKLGPGGNIYIAEFNANRIAVIDAATGANKFYITNRINAPQDITFDGNHDLYVLNYYEAKVMKYTWDDLPPVCAGDYDCDGLTDDSEAADLITNPYNADTDADGLTDGEELQTYGSDPVRYDTDGDDLGDGDEILIHGTNPLNPDSDGDGFNDGQEVATGTDPLDPGSIPLLTTVYEDAEDGLTTGWYVYDDDPFGALITNQYDAERGSRVIGLEGAGRENGYHLKNEDLSKWQNSNQFVIEWTMKYTEPFTVYIDVETTMGKRSMVYVPSDVSSLGDEYYIYHGVGASSIDGQWHTFVRDVQADLLEAQPSAQLLEVNGFLIRGSGSIDDIKLHTTIPLDQDSDGDALTNDSELNLYGSDPFKADTDADGINDGDEVAYWGSVWDADSDSDGLINLLDSDADNDGVSDGQEVATGTDPLDPGSIPLLTTVYEDAEDGLTTGWYVYDDDPFGALITNQYDAERGSRVIGLEGAGRENGYHLKNEDLSKWQNSNQFVIEWTMKYTEPFTVYIDVETTMGKRSMVYVPSDVSSLGDEYYIYHGVGASSIDGQWHTFVRDVQADLLEAQPSAQLLEVNGFLIRGSGSIDDIKLHTTIPLDQDSDGDALTNDSELNLYGSDPFKADTDADGINDGDEVAYWGSVWDADSDSDGLINLLDSDADNDGVSDGQEVATGTDPLDPGSIPLLTTVYEDAEDGLTTGWYVYDDDPFGALITNQYDAERGSRVIGLEGAGRENGYHLKNEDLSKWQNSNQFVIEWTMKYTEPFTVYIDVETTMGKRSMVYVPSDVSSLGDEYYIYHGVGASSIDGQWHTFVRDVQADLLEAQPSAQLLEVNGFLIRGSGSIDDIKLHNQFP